MSKNGLVESREELANWIECNVLGDLQTLFQGINCYDAAAPDHKTPTEEVVGGGNFLLAAGCCMAIEYFGHN